MPIQQVIRRDQVANIKPSDIDTQFAIDAAVAVMQSELAEASLSPDMIRGIQLQLAAHFVAVADPSARRENYAGASFEYDIGKGDMGLATTQFGRAAIAMDPTGNLAKAGKKAASLEVLAWKP